MVIIKIKEIINSWDPIDLFPYAPDDEYEVEIKLIEEFISSNRENIDIIILAKEIWNIFNQCFGGDVFKEKIESCKSVAEKILKSTGDIT